MVRVRNEQPLNYDGSVNLDLWIEGVLAARPQLDAGRLRQVCELAFRAEQEAIAANRIWSPHKSSFRTGLDMAAILAELGLDEDSLVAAVIYRAVREGKLPLQMVRGQFGDEVGELVQGVLRMAVISGIRIMDDAPVLGQQKDQLEQARKMLVSLIDDVRVALIKIAERTCTIRGAADEEPSKRLRLAREVFQVYAPLAHRLGIGQLRWQLEDLSFRYMEPEAYREIASQLDGKRSAREAYIKDVAAMVADKLEALGITARVEGRAKHIYSIWQKMREKGIAFSQVYDVRAVRILVDEDQQCYSVLGAVHALWHNIPHEFDDYIANPKENGYRSLHTAVIGPEGKVLEVQIRTQAMHEDAEFGVCSHWRYKGTDEPHGKPSMAYEEKVDWLRRFLDWQEGLDDVPGLTKALLSEIGQDRIYVFTPEGHVVDMVPQATPLDFAYRVHTEVGHRCRGAKVNGRVVPLNQPLQTGDQVEIMTGEVAAPRREWLSASLGYLHTSRARVTVQRWFRQQSLEQAVQEGRELLAAEFRHLGIDRPDYAALVQHLELDGEDTLFEQVGKGDIEVASVMAAWQEQDLLSRPEWPEWPEHQMPLSFAELDGAASVRADAIRRVQGLAANAVRFADCCDPQPGAGIVGVVDAAGDDVVGGTDDGIADGSVGGIVAVHRQDCPQLLRNEVPGQRMAVEWASDVPQMLPVTLLVKTFDRPGLLFDITRIVAVAGLNVTSIQSSERRQNNRVDMVLTVQVPNLDELLHIIRKIEHVANVISVRRVAQAPAAGILPGQNPVAGLPLTEGAGERLS